MSRASPGLNNFEGFGPHDMESTIKDQIIAATPAMAPMNIDDAGQAV